MGSVTSRSVQVAACGVFDGVLILPRDESVGEESQRGEFLLPRLLGRCCYIDRFYRVIVEVSRPPAPEVDIRLLQYFH
jgi:hypothetical protein